MVSHLLPSSRVCAERSSHRISDSCVTPFPEEVDEADRVRGIVATAALPNYPETLIDKPPRIDEPTEFDTRFGDDTALDAHDAIYMTERVWGGNPLRTLDFVAAVAEKT